MNMKMTHSILLCSLELMCVPDPCENGGTCTEDFPNSDFDCACPTGFAGAKCQTGKLPSLMHCG